ncbi:hypothetical protein SAMN06265361_104282 [Laceyella tengchongensis]|uniref:Pyridoxamine 5'-phosphate oxidase family protein n=2 Tax=Laceyella TaxID=292635 RepID=A0AA45WQD4_9BACL|nr:pyridoxamine 5'-phosphate oxidase family protein [Laceyella tengchongensis]SMP24149.1 hypothetical protein SAMN06265361_104282 [Laceyella tengchongensis]
MNPNRSTCPFHALLNKETSRPIRRKTKRLHDEERVRQLLHSTRVGYLGLVDAEGTYVVPLNYVWYQDAIYFHGSEIGRKADALSTAAGPLCFTVAQEYGTIVSTVPAKTGTSYTSVMLFGNVAPGIDLAKATAALNAMLAKYVPGYFPTPLREAHVERYRSTMGSKTIVYRLVPDKIIAKQDVAEPEALFYGGRTQRDDLKKS